jgi:hypothetical protein
MLSDKVKEQLSDRLASRIEEVNLYIIEQIAENILKLGKLSPTKAQQLANILKYGGSYEKIIKELEKATNMNLDEIDRILKTTAEKDYDFAEQFYNLKGVDYIPLEKNYALLNQIEEIKRITKEEYENFSNTSAIGYTIKDAEGNEIFKDISKVYQECIDNAVLSVYQGKDGFEKEFKRVLNGLGESGLKTINYQSGRSMRMDSAIRMNIQGAIRDMENTMQLEIGNQVGDNGVEITVHEYPAPDHEDIQGHQFRLEEFYKMQKSEDFEDVKGKKYKGIKRHIGMWNCYHNILSITVGVNEPQYTDKELEEIKKRNQDGFEMDGKHYTLYQGSQMQRALEREVRKQKDIQISARKAGLNDLAMDSQKNINDLVFKYNELSKVSGLKTKKQRMSVSGYHKLNVKEDVPKVNPSVPTIEEMDNSKGGFVPKEMPWGNWDKELNKYSCQLNSSTVYMDDNVRNYQMTQLENLLEKYPIVSKYLKENRKSLIVYGEKKRADSVNLMSVTGNTRLNINMTAFNNMDRVIEDQKKYCNQKWHSSCKDDLLGVHSITHEFGHILENTMCKKWLEERKLYYNKANIKMFDNYLKDIIFNKVMYKTGIKKKSELKEKFISEYGRSRANYEWFAETFAEMENGFGNELSKALKEYLEDVWKM